MSCALGFAEIYANKNKKIMMKQGNVKTLDNREKFIDIALVSNRTFSNIEREEER